MFAWNSFFRGLLSLLFFLPGLLHVSGQVGRTVFWEGRSCAVVLTYDDARDDHLDVVIPMLDSAGLRGTFYLPGNSVSLYRRLDEWRAAAAEGHELGNHTLFHPCYGEKDGKKRAWVKADYDLLRYSLQRYLDEVRVDNTLLKAIDGKEKRTFAYSCGETVVAGRPLPPEVKRYCVAARGTRRGLNDPGDLDLYDLKVFSINSTPFDTLVARIRQAEEEGALLIFLMHGVGRGTPYSLSVEDHRRLVNYLASRRETVWVAPLREIAGYLKEKKRP